MPGDATSRESSPVGNLDINLSRPIELIVLSVKERAARCRLLGVDATVTLRSSGLWSVVPGEIITVRPRKQWRYAGHRYLAGDIVGSRLDVATLGLAPLRLVPCGVWDPAEEYWREEQDVVEDWVRRVIAGRPRPEFEMEQVLPGTDPDDPDDDPITESIELKDSGNAAGARRILMALLESDLRCLDGHAHLGNLMFDVNPGQAVRHYEVGMRIGALALGEGFHGVLRWGYTDNRPFLRCMSGYGLCLWRLGRWDKAEAVFARMLSLLAVSTRLTRALALTR